VILLTGGFGYLGGRIARHLAGAGYDVRVTTRRGADAWPEWHGDVDVVRLDPGDSRAWDDACRGADAVVHLAAMNEVDCGSDPIGALEANGVDTVRVLRAALSAKVPRFVYFSTARVYSEPLVGRIEETLNCRPVHPYGISHRVAEDYILAEHAKKRVAAACLRLSNALGAPADPKVNRWTLVANDLCRQVAQSGKMVLKSSGIALRDFIPMAEVARGVEFFLTVDPNKFNDGVFNLGVGRSTSIRALADLIQARAEAVLGVRPEIERPEPGPNEVAEPLDFRVDKLAAAGFRASADLTDEIDATLRLCYAAFAGHD
jgi:UDP-glucose 4-epimerase